MNSTTQRAKSPTNEQISARAHKIWQEAGRPEGQAAAHWRLAEQQLLAEAAVTEPGKVRSKPAASPQPVAAGGRRRQTV